MKYTPRLHLSGEEEQKHSNVIEIYTVTEYQLEYACHGT